MLAAKAYDCYNADLSGTGLAINVPETMWNVPRAEVSSWSTAQNMQAHQGWNSRA